VNASLRVSFFGALVIAIAIAVSPSNAHAQAANTVEQATPEQLKHVGVDEHLDAQVPLDAQFRDQTGKAVKLGDYFDGKRPVILTFAYHSCPMLCSMLLNATMESLKNIGWRIGKEFDVLTISFDPNESLEKSAAKRDELLAGYGYPADNPHANKGWNFLIGNEANIKRTTEAVGYNYTYDAEEKQFGHPAVIMLLKPNGHVSRYLYGIEYSPTDLKLGLLEATEGKSVTTVERVILFCYRYDPHEGKYVVVANRVMRIGGGMCALGLGAFLGFYWRKERKRSKKLAAQEAAAKHDAPTDVAPPSTHDLKTV
jgi:protein SCO1/2